MDALNAWGPLIAILVSMGGLIGVVLLSARRDVPHTILGPDDWIKYRDQLDRTVLEMRGLVTELQVLQIKNGQQELTIARLTDTLERQGRDAWLRDTYLREMEVGLTRIPTEWQSRVLAAIQTTRPPVLAAPPVKPPPTPIVRHAVTAEALSALVGIIAGANWVMDSQESRTALLLAGLPPKFTRNLTRAAAADTDLRNMILTAFNFSDEVILDLLNNAAAALNGSTAGTDLAAWRERWGFAPK